MISRIGFPSELVLLSIEQTIHANNARKQTVSGCVGMLRNTRAVYSGDYKKLYEISRLTLLFPLPPLPVQQNRGNWRLIREFSKYGTLMDPEDNSMSKEFSDPWQDLDFRGYFEEYSKVP